MYSNRPGYASYGDGREIAPKRQRVIDQTSSYYGTSPTYGASSTYGVSPAYGGPSPYAPSSGSTYYNPTPYSTSTTQIPPFPAVRLRGLPFDCTEVEISEFLSGLDIVDILLVHKGGRFSGEAYCVLGYPAQVDFALKRNKHNIGRRYVEVFRSKRTEYYRAVAYEVLEGQTSSPRKHSRARSHDERKDLLEHTGILRLRGLPYSTTKEDVKNFFEDFSLNDDVIHITYNSGGRPSGEAFVEFDNFEASKSAMVKDNMSLGKRYIELFPASREEMDEAIGAGRPGEEDVNEPVKHTGILRLRGLPYSVTKEDVTEFFKGFVLTEDSFHITCTSKGKPTGEAFVEFASAEDSEAAMVKDRKTLGTRYIELFASSQEELNEALPKGQ